MLPRKKKSRGIKRQSVAAAAAPKKEIFSQMNRFLKSRPSPEDLVEKDILKPGEAPQTEKVEKIALSVDPIKRLVKALLVTRAHEVRFA